MRKTKIIATVGPACQDIKVLKALIAEGVDVFRINASHTNPEGIEQWAKLIDKAAIEYEKNVAILVDLQGPRVRTGLVDGGKLKLEKGDKVTMEIGNHKASGKTLTTTCRPFTKMVKNGDPILIDNGALALEIKQVHAKSVSCVVTRGGILGQNKGINLPNAPTTLPALTSKDLDDLKAAKAMDADYVALSFVRSYEDLEAIKKWMKKNNAHIPVIAKIEKPKAVDGIGPILELTDGIMVARGDLGIEMGVEKVPSVQKMLIRRAAQFSIPVITATQMLETMMENPYPTRAEVSDIANAVFDGTDAVMLSGETAIGKFPVEAVRTMRKIIQEAEKSIHSAVDSERPKAKDENTLNLYAITHAALYAAKELGAKAIVVFTKSGKTAQYVSKLNPECGIVAVSDKPQTVSQLKLLRGVTPIFVSKCFTADEMIRKADMEIMRAGILKKGDRAVIVSGKRAFPSTLFMTSLHRIGESGLSFGV